MMAPHGFLCGTSPGRKTFLHDGRQLHLTSEIGSSRVRLLG
jgi:hypothetical protein